MDLSYQDHLDVLERLRKPIGEAFKLTEDQIKSMNFNECVAYADVISSRMFEGTPNLYEFSESQLQDIKNINKWWNRGKLTAQAKKLYSSFMLVEPIKRIDEIVKKIANGEKPQPKFLSYSGHDTQIQLLWEFLEPLEGELPDNTPFASFIQMELHYEQKCISEMKDF
jgi:hypothetical protein